MTTKSDLQEEGDSTIAHFTLFLISALVRAWQLDMSIVKTSHTSYRPMPPNLDFAGIDLSSSLKRLLENEKRNASLLTLF